MAEFGDKRSMLHQNLMDAGFDEELIKVCMVMYDHKELDDLKRTLSMHRKEMLKDLHYLHHEIDCLDYLLFRLDKET